MTGDFQGGSPTRDRMLLIIVAALIFFTNLGAAGLWDRDEPRNAGCAREMLQRGDWIVPTFNGQLRSAKPPLQYWGMMVASLVFGDSEFAARFWSAVLGIGTVLLTYSLGCTLFDRRTALLGGLVLGTSVMMGVAARIATPDSHLIFLTTASLLVFARWLTRCTAAGNLSRPQQHESTRCSAFPTRVVVLFYGLMGLAVLAKGPVGVVLPLAIVVLTIAFLTWCGEDQTAAADAARNSRWTSVFRFPFHVLAAVRIARVLPGLLVTLAVALPWYVWVGAATNGVWISEFFLKHNLDRALTPLENHSGPPFYYLIAILIGFFPWSVFMIPLASDLLRRDNRRPDAAEICLAAWILVWVGAFSLASTKLPSYVTPVYPALALLTSRYLQRWETETLRSGSVFRMLPVTILGISGAGIAAGIMIAGAFGFPDLGELAILGFIEIAAAMIAVWLMRVRRTELVVPVLIAAGVVFAVGLSGFGAAHVSRLQTSRQLVDAIDAQGPATSLASIGCLEPSWVYYAGRPIREFAVADADDAGRFLSEDSRHFLITTARIADLLKPRLPDDIVIVERQPYFLKQDEQIVVLQRRRH